jgi:hypothetical protein
MPRPSTTKRMRPKRLMRRLDDGLMLRLPQQRSGTMSSGDAYSKSLRHSIGTLASRRTCRRPFDLVNSATADSARTLSG